MKLNRMHVRMIRHHMIGASVAAMAIQMTVITLIVFGHIPESTFETNTFRCHALLSILLFIVLLHHIGRRAYNRAFSRNEISVEFAPGGADIGVSQHCRCRLLVVMYLRLNGRSVVLSESR